MDISGDFEAYKNRELPRIVKRRLELDLQEELEPVQEKLNAKLPQYVEDVTKQLLEGWLEIQRSQKQGQFKPEIDGIEKSTSEPVDASQLGSRPFAQGKRAEDTMSTTFAQTDQSGYLMNVSSNLHYPFQDWDLHSANDTEDCIVPPLGQWYTNSFNRECDFLSDYRQDSFPLEALPMSSIRSNAISDQIFLNQSGDFEGLDVNQMPDLDDAMRRPEHKESSCKT